MQISLLIDFIAFKNIALKTRRIYIDTYTCRRFKPFLQKMLLVHN